MTSTGTMESSRSREQLFQIQLIRNVRYKSNRLHTQFTKWYIKIKQNLLYYFFLKIGTLFLTIIHTF